MSVKEFELLTWTPEMVKRYWDYLSQCPETFFTHRYGAELARQIAPFLPPSGKVLDYGCGPGNLTERLLATGLEIAGLDYSPSTRETVNQRFKGRENFLGAFDQEQLLEQNIKFDVIIVLEVIEHLYDEQLDELLSNVQALLTPGGTAIFTTPNEEDLERKYILCPVSGKLFHRWQHVRSWSRESAGIYLSSRSFDIKRIFTTDFGITFHVRDQPHPMRTFWHSLRKHVKYKLKRRRKKYPHLVVIAGAPSDEKGHHRN